MGSTGSMPLPPRRLLYIRYYACPCLLCPYSVELPPSKDVLTIHQKDISDHMVGTQTFQRAEHGSENTLQATVVRTPFSPRSSGVCLCQRVPFSQIYAVVGPVVIFKRTLGTHRPGCRHHNGGKQTRTKEWFGFVLTCQYGQTWAASLTRLIVTGATSFLRRMTCTRVFDDDERNIPGFRRIYHARKAISQIAHCGLSRFSTGHEIQECREVLLKLRKLLENDFSVSRDWEGVQTAEGKTLLFVSIYSDHHILSPSLRLISLLQALIPIMDLLWEAQEEFVDPLESIIELLVAGGTPTDAMIFIG